MGDIKPGDILCYWKFHEGIKGLAEHAVVLGELLEDGLKDREYFHCAVAINAIEKFEINGRRAHRAPIDFGRFDAFRPPIAENDVQDGLAEVEKLEGENYDWLLIADDGLRYATNNLVHLPEVIIEHEEEHSKICLTLVHYYLKKCNFHTGSIWDSPEDLALQLKQYKVNVG